MNYNEQIKCLNLLDSIYFSELSTVLSTYFKTRTCKSRLYSPDFRPNNTHHTNSVIMLNSILLVRVIVRVLVKHISLSFCP